MGRKILDDKDHIKERELPSNVEIYDAYKHEEPKNKGFGERNFVDYVKNYHQTLL